MVFYNNMGSFDTMREIYTCTMFSSFWCLLLCSYTISMTRALGLSSIFAASSARPPPQYWIEGHMKTGWRTFFANALLWAAILAIKIVFDYFVIIQPLVGPVRDLELSI